MVVVSRRYKATPSAGYANYGCSINRSRGSSVCANGRTISQRKVTDAAVAALRDQLTRPDLMSRFVESFSKHFDEAKRGAGGEVRELELQAERAAGRVKNVTAAMAAVGFSEA